MPSNCHIALQALGKWSAGSVSYGLACCACTVARQGQPAVTGCSPTRKEPPFSRSKHPVKPHCSRQTRFGDLRISQASDQPQANL